MSPKNPKKAKLFDISRIPMDLARLVCSCLLPIYRVKRITPEGEKYREKIHGGAIIAANHSSFSDPFAVGVTFWYRRMFFLVAEVVMGGFIRSLLLKGVGAIKIDRAAADVEAIKKCIKVLKDGRLLTVFPQGGITDTKDVETIKSGAALIALRAGVPIIPIHICPRPHWYSRLTVVIGKTIYPDKICKKKMPSTRDLNEISDILMAEMNRCNLQ